MLDMLPEPIAADNDGLQRRCDVATLRRFTVQRRAWYIAVSKGKTIKVTTKPDTKPRRVVLVVDDKPYVCRALARLLKYQFEEVVVANTPQQAAERLRDNSVTHVVCDCTLGPGLPCTTDLVPLWRASCPSIERVVLYSGTDLTNKYIPAEVDAVVPKSAEPRDLLKALEG
jgi:CheY-like chemotaxis protein